jgi:hypothetical protein
MAVCIAAFITFSILGLFSAKYRPLAKEAFGCVFKMVTFKPCDTKLNQRIKSKVTSKALKKNPKLGKFVFKHFNKISLIFVIIFFLSLSYSALAVYNLTVHGTCDLQSNECVLTDGQICGGSNCQDQCLCDQETCESPEYKACKGDCDCQKEICEGA